MDKIKRIEENLDRVFNRNMMADDDDETPLAREVFILEDAVREILNILKDSPKGA